MLLAILLAILLAFAQASATSILQMNLAQLTERSDLIVRGSIVEVRELRVTVGGGDLPALHYRVEVDETFKGKVRDVKGVPIAEFKVLGSLKKLAAGKPIIAGWPELRVGREYLLFVAAPGSSGLTVTTGIGQGCFVISDAAASASSASASPSPLSSLSSPSSSPSLFPSSSAASRDATAVNGFGNVGLFRGMSAAGLPRSGPIAYGALADRIRAELGR
jgi:hypothetical protein